MERPDGRTRLPVTLSFCDPVSSSEERSQFHLMEKLLVPFCQFSRKSIWATLDGSVTCRYAFIFFCLCVWSQQLHQYDYTHTHTHTSLCAGGQEHVSSCRTGLRSPQGQNLPPSESPLFEHTHCINSVGPDVQASAPSRLLQGQMSISLLFTCGEQQFTGPLLHLRCMLGKYGRLLQRNYVNLQS